jgi:hypothetical protein
METKAKVDLPVLKGQPVLKDFKVYLVSEVYPAYLVLLVL